MLLDTVAAGVSGSAGMGVVIGIGITPGEELEGISVPGVVPVATPPGATALPGTDVEGMYVGEVDCADPVDAELPPASFAESLISTQVPCNASRELAMVTRQSSSSSLAPDRIEKIACGCRISFKQYSRSPWQRRALRSRSNHVSQPIPNASLPVSVISTLEPLADRKVKPLRGSVTGDVNSIDSRSSMMRISGDIAACIKAAGNVGAQRDELVGCSLTTITSAA